VISKWFATFGFWDGKKLIIKYPTTKPNRIKKVLKKSGLCFPEFWGEIWQFTLAKSG
jgi:hypothetical protein